MIMKSLIAVAAVATIAAGASAPANAKVNVDLYLGGIGPGYGYYDPGYPVYVAPHRPRHYDYDYEYNQSYGISCEEGKDEVRDSGYRKVRAVSCSGKRYTYRARQGGRSFIIKVSRRSGDIVSVQRAY